MIETGTTKLTFEELREFKGLENLSDEKLAIIQNTVYELASVLVELHLKNKI